MRENQPDKSVAAPTAVIENWMRMVFDTGGIERFDDLHIDDINPEWKHRDTWVCGSSESIKLARKIRSRIAPDKVLALMCSLTEESGQSSVGSTDELAAQIDWSPPSLYLFHPGMEPWSNSSKVKVKLLNEIFSGCTCLLTEFVAEGEIETRRTFVSIA